MFFWKFTEDFSTKQMLLPIKINIFGYKKFLNQILPPITWLNPSGALAIFGLFFATIMSK